jgi:hypothetical protein
MRLSVVLMALAGTPLAASTPPADGVEAPRRVLESRAQAVPEVEVLEAQDLLRRGARDLGDALGTFPGVQVVEFPDGRRQLMTDGWMQRVLWCVDGRPLMRAPGGLLDLGELPASLDEVARVELIRTPMSHVYGAGADAGVLNIVTRRLQATRASATAAVRALPGARLGAGGTAHVSHVGEQGGVYGHGGASSMPQVTTQEAGTSAQRRVLAAGVGGALRLHPRVVVRGDGLARELLVDVDGSGGPALSQVQRMLLGGEMVVRLQGQDSLRMEMRAQAVHLRRHTATGQGVQRGLEQHALARYVGEPVAGHQVQAEAGVLGEAAGKDRADGFVATRLRAHASLADTWRLSPVFALEGALRVEATDRLVPAMAPALAVHYQPFPNLFARASASAGYRFRPLVPDADEQPVPASTPDGVRRDVESTRQARFSLTWRPDDRLSLLGEVFRADVAGPGPPAQLGVLTAGLAFGQFRAEDSVSAHTQGVRAQMSARQLVGGLRVDTGYVWLHQAVDDVTGNRLPFAARHQLTLRVAWQPAWLGLNLETSVQALMDRVDTAGAQLPAQGLVHAAVWRALGPVELGCMLDNAMHVVGVAAGPREGRSARCVVRVAP